MQIQVSLDTQHNPFRREYHWRNIFGALRVTESFVSVSDLKLALLPPVLKGSKSKFVETDMKKFNSAFRDGMRYLRARGLLVEDVPWGMGEDRKVKLAAICFNSSFRISDVPFCRQISPGSKRPQKGEKKVEEEKVGPKLGIDPGVSSTIEEILSEVDPRPLREVPERGSRKELSDLRKEIASLKKSIDEMKDEARRRDETLKSALRNFLFPSR